MNKILSFTCLISLLTTTGCIFPGRGHDEDRRHDRGQLIVTPRIVEARAPVVVVAPPVVEVREAEVTAR